MQALHDYLQAHTAVTEQVDAPQHADVGFFRVAATDTPDGEQLRALLRANAAAGEYAQVDVFDGHEHSYLELGAWLGSQDAALRLMGLGELLGLWQLLTPRKMLKDSVPEETLQQLAGAGYITIVAAERG